MKTERRKIGDLGEDIACRYLEYNRHVILERNYLRKWGELDIVSCETEKSGSKLHFIEVKSIRCASIGEVVDGLYTGYQPEDNFHSHKMERFHRIIRSYLAENVSHETDTIVVELIVVYISIFERKSLVKVYPITFD